MPDPTPTDLVATIDALRAEIAQLRAQTDAHHAALVRLCHGEPQDLPEGTMSFLLLGDGWCVSAQSPGEPGANYHWTAHRKAPASGYRAAYAATLTEAMAAIRNALIELATAP